MRFLSDVTDTDAATFAHFHHFQYQMLPGFVAQCLQGFSAGGKLVGQLLNICNPFASFVYLLKPLYHKNPENVQR